MELKELEKLIDSSERYKDKHIHKFKNNPEITLRVYYVFQRILNLVRSYGYDPKTGKKKVRVWKILFSKKSRKEAGNIIDEIIEILSK